MRNVVKTASDGPVYWRLGNSPMNIMKYSIVFLASLAVGSAQAAVVAQYDMADLAVVSGQNSSTSDVAGNLNVTASGFEENLTGGTLAAEFGRADSGLVPAGVNGISARSMNSSPSNPWWEFTVTPLGGATLDLTTLTLDAGAADTIATTTNWDYDVSTTVGGLGVTIGTFDGPSTTGAEVVSTGLSVDLSALASQTSAFTIRITPNRISGTNGAASQRAGWIDNVTLNATVTPVPEPSSAALLGLGGLALIRRRRRR